MTARDVLAEIEQQAAMNSKDGGTTWGLLTLARTDVPRLVAALRAVLDLLDQAAEADQRARSEGRPPNRVVRIDQIERAITEALGADA